MIIAGKRGFTLIEVIVVAGIIAILAGILVPIIFKEIDESRITRAAADVRSISTAMLVFRKDTGQWPVMDDTCNANVTLLSGNGNLPSNLAAMGYDTSASAFYNDHLTADTNGCYSNWKGPYIAIVSADPWGNAYLTNADGFSISDREVWIISAGPNGLMDTPVPNLFG
ncbi:MAG: type II secretion system protein GspG, partial [Nitrospirota bacterium]